jgi:hypothetical protein
VRDAASGPAGSSAGLSGGPQGRDREEQFGATMPPPKGPEQTAGVERGDFEPLPHARQPARFAEKTSRT